jgi:hypothetical protein
MSSTTTQRRPTVTFQTPADSLRQATLKKNMSITQTYYLAHKARAKLSREAAQPDHDLRLLVGHANLLDSLMLELADAEREQERWFNQSVRGAEHTTKEEARRVQWAETIASVPEEDYESDSSEEDYDEDEDIEMINATVKVSAHEVADAMEEDDLEEDYAQLELVRTHSHSHPSPPELVDHESDSSDDESMPPSPEQSLLRVHSDKKQDAAEEEQDHHSFYDEGYYVSRQTSTTMVTPISVY